MNILHTIGGIFTIYGIGLFVIGIVYAELEFIKVGLLAMILGELVDMPKTKLTNK